MSTALRHYCRNLKCRTKLKAPVDNHHRAFCTPYCYNQFYSWKCKVCEKPILKGNRRKSPDHCHSADCRKDFRRYREAFSYPQKAQTTHGSQTVDYASRSAHFTGVKSALRTPVWGWYRGGIVGPKRVVQAAVIDAREWHEVISPDDVKTYVSRITPRALRDGGKP
jgi:hypothetical protein